MAITRTPIVDDDGSGTTGTVLNNTWKQELYDQIDGVAVGGSAPITGGGIITLPAGTSVVRVAPATPLTIAGFTGGSVNQQFLLHNIGPSYVRIAHEDVSAAAGDRVVYLPSVRGQLLGLGGMVRCVYDTTTTRWRMFLVQPGAPIAVPYVAGDYTASAGTWTVDAGDMVYNTIVQDGGVLQWFFRLTTFSVSNAGAQLYAKLPHGFSAGTGIGGQLSPQIRVKDGASPDAMGMFYPGIPSATQATFFSTLGGAGFAVAANVSEVQGMARFPIL